MKIGNIKFKAKRLDNGEWVKGDLAHSLDGGLNIFGFTRENGVDCYSGVHLIDPETVCQFTGMKDCKGNEIWEGDIVNDNYDLLCIDNLYEIVYIEEEGTFAFRSLDKVDNYEPFVNLIEVYVVGNKFDKEK
jgi:uncharacterized phage protein (TIGR01671 family)